MELVQEKVDQNIYEGFDGKLIITRSELEAVFLSSRNKETSLDPTHWIEASPGWFHCLSSAIILRTYFGGCIAYDKFRFVEPTNAVREIAVAKGVNVYEDVGQHFFLNIGGKIIDITKNYNPQMGIMENVSGGRTFSPLVDEEKFIGLHMGKLEECLEILKPRIQENLATLFNMSPEELAQYIMDGKLIQLVD